MRKPNAFLWLAFVVTLTVAANILLAGDSKLVVAVAGDVPVPERYSLEQLQSLRVIKVITRDHDGTEAEYTGVAVEDLLRRAGAPLGEHLRGPDLAKVVIIHAARVEPEQ
ncbi:MAG: hypothetical protein ACLQVY_06015 [Limisphaerales bacterium]